MLEGVKIVIERLQMDELDEKWIYIAEDVLADDMKIFSEQEKNELRNVYRTAKRKQFNGYIIGEIADRSDRPKAQKQKIRMQAQIKRDGQPVEFMRKVNNYE